MHLIGPMKIARYITTMDSEMVNQQFILLKIQISPFKNYTVT